MGFGVGIVLQAIAPWRLFWPAWIRHGVGWPLILVGLGLTAGAVRAAADVDMERPSQIVVSGPYAFSRNPMYVAWSLIYPGVALVVGAPWPLVLLPVVLLSTHVAVGREERALEGRFGAAYRGYKASVRRYL